MCLSRSTVCLLRIAIDASQNTIRPSRQSTLSPRDNVIDRELLASILGVTLDSRLSGYVFQRRGKHRMLAFNSEIEITSETNGNWYIEQLLAKPTVAFRCTHLESLLAGLAEETSTGSIGEVVDMETLRGYHDRLQEIDEEIEEAISFHDPARQADFGSLVGNWLNGKIFSATCWFSCKAEFSRMGKRDFLRKESMFSCIRHFSQVRKWTKTRKSNRSLCSIGCAQVSHCCRRS